MSRLNQLSSAVKSGDLELLKVLILTSEPLSSPVDLLLQQACVNGHQDIVSYLIEEKYADVNASFSVPYEEDGVIFPHSGKKSPLMEAVEGGHAAIVKQLVGVYHANVDLINSFGESALRIACRKGNTEIVNVLLAHSGQSDDEQVMYFLLEIAIEHGHTEIVSCLLQSGAKIINEKRGFSALNTACKRGSTEMVKFILENGGSAHVNYIESIPGGRSPLMGASYDKIELLLRYNADVNAVNKRGDFPLLIAIESKSFKAVKLLIKGGANVNQIHEGSTLLMMVIKELHKEKRQDVIDILRALLDGGADVNIEDENKNTILLDAVRTQSVQIMHWIINKGAHINQQNRRGKSPLMLAASYNNYNINNLLITKGAKINLQDELQQTPLMVAAGSGHTDVVRLYLEKGADVNLQDSQGNYALLSAIEEGNYEISDLLLKKGANAKLSRADGKSAATILEERCIKKELHLGEDLIEMNNALLKGELGRNYAEDDIYFIIAKTINTKQGVGAGPKATFMTQLRDSGMSSLNIKDKPSKKIIKIHIPGTSLISDTPGSSTGFKREGGNSESEEDQATKKDLRGIDILHTIRLEVTSSSQSFHWKEYGLKLTIPAQSLPENTKTCEIMITVSLSGNFKFPEGVELVSPVFYLRCEPNCSFTNPLSLEIQHCALPENNSNLSMSRATLTEEPPYSFEVLHGGNFSKSSSFGVIELKSFSFFSVIQKFFGARRYWYDVFDIFPHGDSGKDIHFAITWDDSAHIKRVKDYYADLRAQSHNIGQPIAFQQDQISLDVPEEGKTLGDWEVYPDFPPIIRKTTVDHSASVPHCVLKTRWTGNTLEVKPLKPLRIHILGTSQEINYFTIDSPAQAKKVAEKTPSQVVPLTGKDQPKITQYLAPLRNPELIKVGSSLGLKYTSLSNMNADCLLNDMVNSWLRRDDDVIEKSGEPTWKTLCNALTECGYNGIASAIRRNEEVN